ncbi:hypothetical protein FPSE_07391 [Fusarium pseudograminearum CS3096]|uniref:Glycosyltransferase family 32 protein n=1 Tax=Fusarium pseudograminearum (strain CS3096) TaxID=1028729 RepID=K3VZJ5_FUSPC|nr:hypothetical protein FPSE_07391 [Fusarium pseudograminearum CS3096]EKJ72510.1 hypothetical protein FPSE_07391 [Fusarium pseudograminearum CS3096]
MTRKFTLFSVLLRPSRYIRLLALSLLLITVSWPFAIKLPVIRSHKGNIEKDYPLINQHIHSSNGTGGGMRSLIQEFENDFLDTYDSILTPVERSDVFRILVCKNFGGIYGDLDTELIRHPASWIGPSDTATWTDDETGSDYGYHNDSAMLDNETRVVNLLWGLEADNDPNSDAYWRQSYTYPQQLSQWAFAAAPHHPVVTRYMENLRSYTKDNETAAMNSDPLKRTGPAAVTLATKSWLEDHVGFRWTSLTGVKDGGRPKLVNDVLVLPITAFHPSHGSRTGIMGRKPMTDPDARLCHHGTGSWKHFDLSGEYGKICRRLFGLCRDWPRVTG